MARFFGVDFPATIGNALLGAGGLEPGMLQKVATTVNPVDKDDVTKTTTAHPFQGTLRSRSYYRNGALVRVKGMQVQILANTLPGGVVPGAKDRIEMRGTIYEITDVDTDAAEVFHTCLVS